MAETTAHTAADHGDTVGTRRDFIILAGAAMGTVGTAIAAWPFVHTMNPAADTLALATVEVDLAPVKEGQAITVMWRGKPVFIRHRTTAEIEEARKVDIATLRDKQSDEDRVKDSTYKLKAMPQWLIAVGVCTHLGCVPKGQKPTEPHGEFGGWFCPCHGSHYDTSGRIRKGPAPRNLEVPVYEFLTESRIKIIDNRKA